MKIHELAQKTGLTPPTIRFYEQEGLLDARYVRREKNNYRDYCEETVGYLLKLKRIQAAGFTLAEFKAVIEINDTSAFPRQKKIELMRQKMEEIDRRKAELEQIQADLAQMLARSLARMEAEEKRNELEVLPSLSSTV